MVRVRCPKCKEIVKKRHCVSPYCTWHICVSCTSPPISTIVFDKKNRYFSGRA